MDAEEAVTTQQPRLSRANTDVKDTGRPLSFARIVYTPSQTTPCKDGEWQAQGFWTSIWCIYCQELTILSELAPAHLYGQLPVQASSDFQGAQRTEWCKTTGWWLWEMWLFAGSMWQRLLLTVHTHCSPQLSLRNRSAWVEVHCLAGFGQWTEACWESLGRVLFPVTDKIFFFFAPSLFLIFCTLYEIGRVLVVAL